MKRRVIKKVRAIIYDIKRGKSYFLIFHRTLHWKGWEVLKETIESGETLKEALKRGIKEETGLKDFKIIKSLKKQEDWQAMRNDYKVVDVFLVKANMNQKISLKQEVIEHDSYQWVDRETALKNLTWPETKEILKKIRVNEH